MITFYSPAQSNGYLSNFAQYGFITDNCWFDTVEHYYQANKFIGTGHYHIIRKAPTPKMAALAGRNPLRPLRPDWEDVKLNVMLDGIRYKFSYEDKIKDWILATKNETLVEMSSKDYFWGCGASGRGQNWLGKLLMIVRDELR